MKFNYTKIYLLLVALLSSSYFAHGADLIVEEFGTAPNFNSIQAAINAATDGDRIFIRTKSGNFPYQENITIDKSLELLPAVNDSSFIVFGDYTIVPAAGRTVTIVGMDNIDNDGIIQLSGSVPGGNPCHFNLLGSILRDSVNITGSGVISRISGNEIFGQVVVGYATVTGNDLFKFLRFNPDPSLTSDDSLYIVGNRILQGIIWDNSNQYFYMANNYLRSASVAAIQTFGVKSGSGYNLIENNTMLGGSGMLDAIKFYNNMDGTKIKITNNLAEYSTSSSFNRSFVDADSIGSARLETNYNLLEDLVLDDAATCQNCLFFANSSGSVLFSSVTGISTSTNAINQGHPGKLYTDTDLTRNDRGTGGGSFNINNFFPILTGGSRVFLVKAPRVAIQTTTIRAEAEGYDR